jgi:hypothetical protein
MTLASPSKYDGQVAEWADTLVRLSSDGNRVKAELLKRRSRQQIASEFRMDGLLGSAKRGVVRRWEGQYPRSG